MFPAMLILGNLANRICRRPASPSAEPPRFDFSEARDAYEAHATPTDDLRPVRAMFSKRR
jgi:hypothetical protein